MRGLIWAGAIWGVALAVLLVYTRRRGAKLTWSAEHLAVILLLLGTHAVAGRSSADEVLANPLVLERLVRGGLTAAAGVVVLPSLVRAIRRGRSGSNLPGINALVFYLAVAIVSVSYSVAPVVTIGKVAELAVAVAIAVALALGPEPKEKLGSTIRLILFLEGALVGVAVAGFFLIPGVFASVLPRPGFIARATMVSPYAHPNVLSALGGLLAAYSLGRYFHALRDARRRWLGAFAVSTVAVVLAAGRQGLAIWLVSVAILLFVHRRALFTAALAPATALIVATYWDVLLPVLNRQAPYHLATLTGRVGWWQAALQSWAEHPFTGFGFGAGGRFVALSSIGAGARSNVHSGYIEALIGVGILGVLPLLYCVFRVARWSIRGLRARVDTHLAILIVPLVLHTGIDLGFGAWLKPDFMLLACLVGLADLAKTRVVGERAIEARV